MYLMETDSDQQIGITNSPKTRIAAHKRKGWRLIEILGPADGTKVMNAESQIKHWLKQNKLRIDGTHENWSKENLKVKSLRNIASIAGIDDWESIWLN